MTTANPQIETYLSALDRALGPIQASTRAEIILEIKSHILDALAQDPNRSIPSLLASIGEPETVANRYLLEKGLKPGKSPKSPIVKWLVIGFLGTVALSILSAGVVIYKFFPLVDYDRDRSLVRILGGMISVKGNVNYDDDNDTDGSQRDFVEAIDVNRIKTISVMALNSRLVVKPSQDAQLHLNCKGRPDADANLKQTRVEGDTFYLSLAESFESRCTLHVPASVAIAIQVTNGRLVLEAPRNHISVKMANGMIRIHPDPARHYQYHLETINGAVDHFESSSEPGALEINISLANGRISRD